jgi:pimeloyl-ACP methyl ester carboxylesterase
VVVPALRAQLGLEDPILIGHSDGASIALIHAAEHPVRAVAVMAPHVFVEAVCVDSIRDTRATFASGGLREKMARHHDDPDAAFAGWSDVWLSGEFAAWNIEALLPAIEAPLLLIQGVQDEYGTLAQIDAIERGAGGPVQRLIVPGGHSPHLAAPDLVRDAVVTFVSQNA